LRRRRRHGRPEWAQIAFRLHARRRLRRRPEPSACRNSADKSFALSILSGARVRVRQRHEELDASMALNQVLMAALN